MQIVLNCLSLTSFYLCFALGLALVFGVMRIINFAHGEFFMIGAYATYLCVATLAPQIGGPSAWLVGAIVAAGITGLLGAVLYRTVVVPLADKPLAIFIATLALSYVLQTIVVQIFGPVGLSISPPLRGVVSVGGAILPASRAMVIVAAAALSIGLWIYLMRTESGRRIRAVAQNPRGALLQGIKTRNVGNLTLIIGSGIAGICGAAMGPISQISPYMGGPALWKAFIIIIVGGIGNVWGAVAAAAIFGVLDTLMSQFGGGRFLALTSAAIMLFVLSVKPSGLFGEKE
ncbi:ABC transporter permease (plasmid) [Mesorhizobium loti]|nr:branched-chain amino acid ABC transporter permease [Mesorhizobium japonicum]BAV52479.1 ABC transporter permease [Mesorhizobium loti]